MSRGYFVEIKKRDDDMTELDALTEFESLWQSLPASRKQGADKHRKILQPLEQFVFTFNDRAQIERTTWGTKDVRNPDAGSIKELVDQMGSDHQKFSDASIAKTLNGRWCSRHC